MNTDRTSSPMAVVPPPWKLRGDGLILLYRFQPDALSQLGSVGTLNGEFRGGIGALMLVDYTESGVGPYRELLFIPGRFRIGKIRAHSISKIYVSTEASVISGRANWGIPKEQADFRRTHQEEVQGWQISSGGHEFFRIQYTPGTVSFRVGTWPFFVPLVQQWEGKTYVTRLRAHGVAKLATIRDLHIDSLYFPAVQRAEPLGVLRVTTFSLTFPVPRIVP